MSKLKEFQKENIVQSKINLIDHLFKTVKLVDNNWFDNEDIKNISKNISSFANKYEKILTKEFVKFNKEQEAGEINE